MSDKINIDRLFQEKFKDFEVEPNEQIWINIDAALREKKKRRIVPFWFKATGIAAGFVLGFLVLNFFSDDATSVKNNSIVNENQSKPTENNTLTAPNQESVVTSGNASENNTNAENPAAIDPKTNTNGSFASPNNAIANQKKPSTKKGSSSSVENNAVTTTGTQVEKTSKERIKNKLNLLDSNTKNNAVAHDNQLVQKQKKEINNNENSNVNARSSDENQGVASKNITKPDTNQPLNSNQKSVLNTDNSAIANNQKSTDIMNSSADENLKNGTDKKDSTAIAKVEAPNALEELLKKNEEEKNTVAEAKINRWQISSNVAPIYFSSTSNGSPIDAQFAENSKSYENNLSFGVGVNYAINKKLSVRTGVNKFTLGYNTNDVVFLAALDNASLGSVASSTAGATIQVFSESNTEALRPFDNGIQNTNEGIMTQRMGYFEVPVEMSYKLVDKKFGIDLIGGLSTLFLDENEVSVSSSTMSASLGRAKNLNDVHFSTNVGLGFRYRFWKAFEANFEPMFKYQINTFNKDAGNFKPYFIGLYSGVSFNF